MPVELRELIIAAQHRSLRRAAEALNVRQSTLSRRIRDLEHQLEAALFERTNGGTIYGTGYEEAKGLIEGTKALPASFGLMKLGATILSYISGIPGGIFAPSLAVGAGLGANISHLLPGVPAGAVIILGMVGYFTGVV